MQQQNETFFLPDFCSVTAVLFLILVAELLAIVVTLAAVSVSGYSWAALGNTSLFLQWVVLPSAGMLCFFRRHFAHLSLPAAAGTSYTIILVNTLVVSLLGQWVMGAGEGARISTNLTLSHLLISAILAGIALRYFYLQQQLRLQQRAELQARIEALQARIRPHFLFNSMNSIASLIVTDPELAEQVVEDLADLFRQSLSMEQTEVVIGEEIEFCRRFARIEALRLGDRLRLEWQVGELPRELRIPRFTLQPLIENAIYHGVQPLADGGVVSVAIELDGDLCVIAVSNPVNPDAVGDPGNQMALDNIERRLKAVYGNQAEVVIDASPAAFAVRVSYPWANSQESPL